MGVICEVWAADKQVISPEVSKVILKSILKFTGNQWRECSSGALQVNDVDFDTTRASGFWTPEV